MIESDLKKERSYTVYKHTSPSGKCYIGITGQNPPEKDGKMDGDINTTNILAVQFLNMDGTIFHMKYYCLT